MSKGLAYWIVYLLCLLLGIWFSWPLSLAFVGGQLPIFILLGLLGWSVYGAPIQ